MVGFRAVAPAPLTSVEFGVTVSMFALVSAFGTPAFQLRGLNQPLEFAPVQLVWACVETVDAAKSAIAASNPDETILPPARAGEVAPLRGPMDDSRCRSHPISAPNQSAMPIMKTGPPQPRTSPGREGVRNLETQTKLANLQDHNRYEGSRNCGDGECGFAFSDCRCSPATQWAAIQTNQLSSSPEDSQDAGPRGAP